MQTEYMYKACSESKFHNLFLIDIQFDIIDDK